MKKKIILISIFAFLGFLFWIYEDLKKEIYYFVKQYKIECSNVEFKFPNLLLKKAKILNYEIDDVKISFSKLFAINSIDIKKLKYKKIAHEKYDTKLSNKLLDEDFDTLFYNIKSNLEKFFNKFSINYLLPKRVKIDSCLLLDKQINNMDLYFGSYQIDCCFQIQDINYSLMENDFIKGTLHANLIINKNLNVSLILKSNENIVNFNLKNTILKNGLRFFGDIEINDYEKLSYDFFKNNPNFNNGKIECYLLSKFGNLNFNIFAHDREFVKGEYEFNEHKILFSFLSNAESSNISADTISDNVNILYNKLLHSNFNISCLEKEITAKLDFISNIFYINYKDGKNICNFSNVKNKIDFNCKAENFNCILSGEIDKAINTLFLNNLKINFNDYDLYAKNGECKISYPFQSLNIPKIYNKKKGYESSLKLVIENNFDADLILDIKKINIFDDLIKGVCSFKIINEELLSDIKLQSKKGMHIFGKTKNDATVFKLKKNKNLITCTIPNKITIHNALDILQQEDFILEGNLHCKDFIPNVNSGMLDFKVDFTKKDDVNGFINLQNV